MLIDWFTVVAQVINFLILVWLMKRFLYKPILNAIAAREASRCRRRTPRRGVGRDGFPHPEDTFPR